MSPLMPLFSRTRLDFSVSSAHSRLSFVASSRSLSFIRAVPLLLSCLYYIIAFLSSMSLLSSSRLTYPYIVPTLPMHGLVVWFDHFYLSAVRYSPILCLHQIVSSPLVACGTPASTRKELLKIPLPSHNDTVLYPLHTA